MNALADERSLRVKADKHALIAQVSTNDSLLPCFFPAHTDRRCIGLVFDDDDVVVVVAVVVNLGGGYGSEDSMRN